MKRQNRREPEAEPLPEGFGPPAGRHDEVRSAAGSPRAVLQAGGLGRQRADVSQVTRSQAATCAARGDVAVQHLAVHHWLLALLQQQGAKFTCWLRTTELFVGPSQLLEPLQDGVILYVSINC